MRDAGDCFPVLLQLHVAEPPLGTLNFQYPVKFACPKAASWLTNRKIASTSNLFI